MIPDWATNTVLISDVLPSRHPEIVRLLKDTLHAHSIPLGIVPGMADVWIRDAAPVQIADGKFVQFRYAPDYLLGYEHLVTPANAFRKFPMFQTSQSSDIVLDGGNVVGTNSTAILTDKIYRENPRWNQEDLRRTLQQLLEVARLIVIPQEPGDEIGHADGMVRFLDDQRVAINDYRKIDPPLAPKLEGVLAADGLTIVRLPYRPEKKTYRGIPSAVGNYVNYLRVGDLILLPAYDRPEDEAARSALADQLPQATIVMLPCRKLARHGGALNCATWTGWIPMSA